MSNQLATSNLVAKTALAVLENMLSFTKSVNRDYEDEFGKDKGGAYASGQTINIKRPPRYSYRAGRVAAPQSTVENTIPLTLQQGGVDISFTSLERTLSLTSLEDKLRAAMAPVANEIDRQGLAMAHYSTFNALNASGALPTTSALAIQSMTQMGQRLDEMAAPRDGRRAAIFNPAMNASLVQGFGGFFNNQAKLATQYNEGVVQDNSFGFGTVGMDQNVDVHTNGTATATNINGANQTGNSITVVATTGGTLTRGTVISLPGVFAVNPQSRQSTGQLAQFVVTADVLTGSTSIPISPAIIPSGNFQNVTASPTNGQPYVIFGAAGQTFSTNVAFHKDAFTLACVPMWAPAGGKGVVDVARKSYKGLNLRVIEYFDGTNDVSAMRIDVLFGWAAPYPELAVKYYSQP
jgi:hypothetical protein